MGTNLMQSKHHLSGLALAAAAAVLATVSAAALADRDTPQPKSVTVSFGEWKIDPPVDRGNIVTANPRAANNHEVLPHEIKIRAGDSINFIISGFHQIQIFENVSAANLQMIALNAARVDGILVDIPDGRIYRGLNPNDQNGVDAGVPRPAAGTPPVRTVRNNQDRIEVVKFAKPGHYLVACAVLPHLVNDNMYALITVKPAEGDKDKD